MMPRKTLLLYTALAVLIGLAAMVIYEPTDVRHAERDSGMLQLVALADETQAVIGAYNALRKNNKWLDDAPEKNLVREAAVPVPWEIMGIFKREDEHYILLQLKNDIKRINIGEPLPDKSVLKRIMADRIESATDESLKTYLLYSQQSQQSPAGRAVIPQRNTASPTSPAANPGVSHATPAKTAEQAPGH